MRRFGLVPLAALLILVAACQDAGQITQPVSMTTSGFTQLIPSTDVSPVDPTTTDDCVNDRWDQFGFTNQDQCERFVETGQDSR